MPTNAEIAANICEKLCLGESIIPILENNPSFNINSRFDYDASVFGKSIQNIPNYTMNKQPMDQVPPTLLHAVLEYFTFVDTGNKKIDFKKYQGKIPFPHNIGRFLENVNYLLSHGADLTKSSLFYFTKPGEMFKMICLAWLEKLKEEPLYQECVDKFNAHPDTDNHQSYNEEATISDSEKEEEKRQALSGKKLRFS